MIGPDNRPREEQQPGYNDELDQLDGMPEWLRETSGEAAQRIKGDVDSLRANYESLASWPEVLDFVRSLDDAEYLLLLSKLTAKKAHWAAMIVTAAKAAISS